MNIAEKIFGIDPYYFIDNSESGTTDGAINEIAKNLKSVDGCIETINFLLDILEDLA